MTGPEDTWINAWPEALAVWSKYTRLVPATLCKTSVAASKEGLEESFAMIRFADQRIIIDLEHIHRVGLDDYATEILAHEIGHHVFTPANATDNLRLLARIRKALPTMERYVPLIANLYTDLLINDRLQRQSSLRMADVYRVLGQQTKKPSSIWALYMRIYEHLWNLPKRSLCGIPLDSRAETDAWLGSRVIRVYAREWLGGAGRFAVLMLPYLLEKDMDVQEMPSGFSDLAGANEGCSIGGIINMDESEDADCVHPAEDPLITGEDPGASTNAEEDSANNSVDKKPSDMADKGTSGIQAREPYEYGEILKSAGIALNDHDIAIAYYRERALPHILPYPKIAAPESQDPLLEGLDGWGLGDPFDELDYLQSLIQSPSMIPGLTTVKRVYGVQSGKKRGAIAVDLDIYIDSSGSMPNPQVNTSWLTLAGTIIALSALRAGARVQATLWSGKGQVIQTSGFVRDERQILSVLTDYFGSSTCFPIHCLRETYNGKKPRERNAHILMISDDGITTMFDNDEKGNSGWDISANAMQAARGGGTFALNLPDALEEHNWLKSECDKISRACNEQGWRLYPITNWEQLLVFARDFSRRHRDGMITATQEKSTR